MCAPVLLTLFVLAIVYLFIALFVTNKRFPVSIDLEPELTSFLVNRQHAVIQPTTTSLVDTSLQWSTVPAQYEARYSWRRAKATLCAVSYDGLRSSSAFAGKKRPARGRRTGRRSKNVSGRFRTWRRRLDRTLPSSAHAFRPASKISSWTQKNSSTSRIFASATANGKPTTGAFPRIFVKQWG